MNKKILGLAAELAGGKGTVAEYVTEKYDGSSYRFSTVLREILSRIYLPDSRENMQKLSTILRQNFGEDTLAKVMAEDVRKDNHEVIAVDGVRRPADIEYLKEIPGFKLIYIEASIENRFERIKKRGENPDDATKTLEQFKKDQEGEADAQIRNMKEHTDYVIDNNGTFEELYEQVDGIINKIK